MTASTRAGADETEDRIDLVMHAILDGTFRPGKSHRELAALWNVGIRRVEEIVTQAIRIIRRVQGDTADTVTRKLAGLEDLRERALKQNNIRGAIDADKLYLMAIGALIQKHEVTTHPIEQLSEPEQLQYVRGLLSEYESRLSLETARESSHNSEHLSSKIVVCDEQVTGNGVTPRKDPK